MSVAAEATALDGTVERITYYNAENGFSVVRLKVRGRREPVAVVGTLPAVQPGETLTLSGAWRTDPRHGAQFEPQTAEVSRPSDADAIVRYLGSGLIRQIGPVLAERIVATFGQQTLDVLDARPAEVRRVPGIGRQRAEAIAAAWLEHRALRAVVGFLSEHGLDIRFAPRLVGAYGADAPKILAANPYRLVAEVPDLASRPPIGSAVPSASAQPARWQAAVHAALLRAAEQGHTRLSAAAIAAEVGSWELGVGGPDLAASLVDAAITQLLASGTISAGVGRGLASSPAADQLPDSIGTIPRAPTSSAGRLRIYEPDSPLGTVESGDEATTPLRRSATRSGSQGPTLDLGLAGLIRAEEDLAARLLALTLTSPPTPDPVAQRRPDPGAPLRDGARLLTPIEAWLAADGDARALSDEQRRAVRTAVTSGCFVLTGGPGVGKTTTVRVLVRCLESLGRSVALAAPTGKAAKRLGEVVGLEAKTLHRLLGAGPRGFRHGPREPWPFDAVIVDEASMLDTKLARAVVRAIRPGAQLILVGDADQLPSVGPGQVLRDVLASGVVPAVRLETIFRQAARSRIVTNAHRIRQGLPPELGPPGALAEGFDCVFVPASGDRIASVAAEWAAVKLPRALGVGPGEVQALAPLTRVCQSLNSLLQERLNPAHGQAERPHGALPLRVGDRVIQTRNNYHLGVFNGDGGTLAEVGPDSVTVDFDDGRRVIYAPADLLDLDHAYCLTVHRSQGSEWPGVVVLASSSYGPMLSRNLLYTALTRARRAAVIVGDQAAIARAVAETRDLERSTGLRALLATPADGDEQPE